MSSADCERLCHKSNRNTRAAKMRGMDIAACFTSPCWTVCANVSAEVQNSGFSIIANTSKCSQMRKLETCCCCCFQNKDFIKMYHKCKIPQYYVPENKNPNNFSFSKHCKANQKYSLMKKAGQMQCCCNRQEIQ